MKFGNEFWLILFQEYISPKLFAVCPIRGCMQMNHKLLYNVLQEEEEAQSRGDRGLAGGQRGGVLHCRLRGGLCSRKLWRRPRGRTKEGYTSPDQFRRPGASSLSAESDTGSGWRPHDSAFTIWLGVHHHPGEEWHGPRSRVAACPSSQVDCQGFAGKETTIKSCCQQATKSGGRRRLPGDY